MTLTASRALAPGQRLGRLEDPVGDFPFYNGVPMSLSTAQWLFVMAAVVASFLVLVLPIPWSGGALGALIPAVLFPVIPLAALARVAPGHWQAIFGKVGRRELRLMLGFALLNIVVSMSVGALVRALADVTPNAATAQLGGMDTAGRIAFFAKTLPQLFGEEVVTILPFLAVLTLLSARGRAQGCGRGRLADLVAALRAHPPADLRLEPRPVHRRHWHRAHGAEPGLDHDEEHLGVYGGAHPQRLAAVHAGPAGRGSGGPVKAWDGRIHGVNGGHV